MEDEDGEDGFLGNTLASDGMQESPIWSASPVLLTIGRLCACLTVLTALVFEIGNLECQVMLSANTHLAIFIWDWESGVEVPPSTKLSRLPLQL